MFAEQSVEVLAFEHVPTQVPLPSHAQRESAAQAAWVLYLYWHRAVHPEPFTTWQVEEAEHVAGSVTTEHLPVHELVNVFQTQSLCDAQAGPVVARNAHRVTQLSPNVLHIELVSQFDTLIGSVARTGIWSHDSVQTRFPLSHMHAGLPTQLA